MGKELPGAFFRYTQIVPLTEDQLQKMKSAALFKLEPIGKEREAAVKAITIKGPFRKNLILKINGLAKPLAELRKCGDALAASWGIDVIKHVDLQRPATPTQSTSKWIFSEDYPVDMLRQGARSLVQFRLMIDDTGTPTSCHIQQSNRLKDFDKLVCKAMMRRARFAPALAKDGTPIASYYVNSVFFQILKY
jgi:Gram-negative bacterial TonB protein C-terminal